MVPQEKVGSAHIQTAARALQRGRCCRTPAHAPCGDTGQCACLCNAIPLLGAGRVLGWRMHRMEPQPSSEGSATAVRKSGMCCRGDMQDGTVIIRPLRSIVLPCFQGFETRKAVSCAEMEFTGP